MSSQVQDSEEQENVNGDDDDSVMHPIYRKRGTGDSSTETPKKSGKKDDNNSHALPVSTIKQLKTPLKQLFGRVRTFDVKAEDASTDASKAAVEMELQKGARQIADGKDKSHKSPSETIQKGYQHFESLTEYFALSDLPITYVDDASRRAIASVDGSAVKSVSMRAPSLRKFKAVFATPSWMKNTRPELEKITGAYRQEVEITGQSKLLELTDLESPYLTPLDKLAYIFAKFILNVVESAASNASGSAMGELTGDASSGGSTGSSSSYFENKHEIEEAQKTLYGDFIVQNFLEYAILKRSGMLRANDVPEVKISPEAAGTSGRTVPKEAKRTLLADEYTPLRKKIKELAPLDSQVLAVDFMKKLKATPANPQDPSKNLPQGPSINLAQDPSKNLSQDPSKNLPRDPPSPSTIPKIHPKASTIPKIHPKTFPGIHPKTIRIPKIHPKTLTIPKIHPKTLTIPKVRPKTSTIPKIHPKTVRIPKIHPKTFPKTHPKTFPEIHPKTRRFPRSIQKPSPGSIQKQ